MNIIKGKTHRNVNKSDNKFLIFTMRFDHYVLTNEY